MVAALSLPRRLESLPEQRMLIHGVSWRDYVILREALDTPGLRMTYLEGRLELMSPSDAHESAKTRIARLVETYAFLLRLRMNGHGSTTFRKQAEQRGAEPDECWVVGRRLSETGFPDVVLEVIETSPLLDKLEVYDGFGVPEVWIFEQGAFTLHRRRKRGGYEKVAHSAFVPRLDFDLIARLAKLEDQQEALEELERVVLGPRAAKRRPAIKKRRRSRSAP
jgi:Uma2 family endonuclease